MGLCSVLSAAAVGGMPIASLAAPCPFDHAIYGNDAGWTLRFLPPGEDAAANQSAAFVLKLRSGVEVDGAIYWPNGYGAPVYTLDGPCSAQADAERCEFLENGGATPYVLTEDGIDRIPEAMDGAAPRQLLLPDLASSFWYSSHREAEFDTDPGDVLTLSGCRA
jgi:hypothetical protein